MSEPRERSPKTTLDFVRFLVRSYPKDTLRTTVLIALSTTAEALGVVTLLPTIDAAIQTGGERGAGDLFGRSVARILGWLGIPFSLVTLVLLITGLMAAKGVFQWLAWRVGGRAMAQIATDFRLRLVESLFAARWSFFIRQPLGSMTTAVGHETYVTAHAYLAMCQLLAAGSLALVYVAAIAVVSPAAVAPSLVVGLMLVAPLRILLRRVRAIANREARAQQSFVANLVNALQSIKPIRAMGHEESFVALARSDADDLRSSIARQVSMTYLMPAAQEPILVLGIALFLVAGSQFLAQDFATMAVVVFALWRCGAHVTFANRAYRELVVAEPYYRQLQRILDASGAARESDPGVRPAPPAPIAITLEDVTFSYGERAERAERILDELSLHLPAGSITAIVGESGAGKTTLIDLLLALHRPTSGRILINGIPLDEISVREWRRRLGYVPQETTLFHGTVRENVTLGDDSVRAEGVRAALEAAGAWDFVAALERGLDTVVGEHGARLSGGQRQRIAIARALAQKPALLLLDEVTASLDPAAEAAVIATIKAQGPNVTVVLATHQPALLAVADVVYRLRGGRVVKLVAA